MTRRKPATAPRVPVLEWIAAALGAAAALVLVGYLVWDGLEGTESAPDLQVTAMSGAAGSGGFVLPIVVVNAGGATAAAVVVVGTGTDGETAEATFDFVPGKSKREGALVFRGNPGPDTEVRVLGYRRP